MPLYKVAIKWGKEKFNDLEVDTDESPELFKAQLFALTSVPPERQKVMLKGSVLKDDSWNNMKLKNGCMLMMMGTAAEIPQAPQEKMVFVEDMTDSQLAATLKLPTGLTNLGNTCYMNATVQCLCTVPELAQGLDNFRNEENVLSRFGSSEQTVLAGLRDTCRRINDNADSFSPLFLVQALYQAFPHFAEKNEHGMPMQQDANECWTQFVRILQQKLPGVTPPTTDENSSTEAGAGAPQTSLIDQYFGVEFQSTLKCSDAPDEPESTSTETLYQLSCFIDKDVKYMHTGLKNRLQETINKNSPTLGRDANYVKSSLISRLPAYLSVQFVRFYYKEKEKINAKILKDVKFPLILDAYELCSPELQKKIIPMRDRFKISDDKKLEEEKRLQETINKNSPTLGRDANYVKSSLISRLPAYLSVQFVRFYYKEKEKINAKILKDVKFPLILDAYELCSPELQKKIIPMRDRFKISDDKKLEEEKKAKLENKKARQEAMDVDKDEKKEYESYSFPDDVGSNNSGLYELQAVLTHQGRSSSSGHYVAWIKGNEHSWVKCDDDMISHITEEDVLRLSGGGDWHCAYVLLYGPRKLEIIPDKS